VRVQGWQTPVRNESDSGWTPAMAAQSAGKHLLHSLLLGLRD
jgi:hypothetical protein